MYLDFQQSKPKDQMVQHEIPSRIWEEICMDIFQISDKCFLCIVDYFIMFPIITYEDCLSAGCLLVCCKSVFVGHSLPKKIVSDVVTNFQ